MTGRSLRRRGTQAQRAQRRTDPKWHITGHLRIDGHPHRIPSTFITAPQNVDASGWLMRPGYPPSLQARRVGDGVAFTVTGARWAVPVPLNTYAHTDISYRRIR